MPSRSPERRTRHGLKNCHATTRTPRGTGHSDVDRVDSRKRWQRCKRPRPTRARPSHGISANKMALRATNSTCRWLPWVTPAPDPFASIRAAAREQADMLTKYAKQEFNGEFNAQALFNPDLAVLRLPLVQFGRRRSAADAARTDGMIHHLVTVQLPDGHWLNNVPRLSDDVERCHRHGVVDSRDQTLWVVRSQGGVRGEHRACLPVDVDGRAA